MMVNRKIAHLAAYLLCIAVIINFDSSSFQGSLRRSLSNSPKMFTFYSKYPDGVKKRTGMSDQDDEELLEAWKLYWGRAGWETHVLTIEDAEAHPSYDEYVKALEGLPFGYYDKLCFLRWLAISQVGGGWISDYDTFPLEDFTKDAFSLPNEGRFTTYERIVPSLASGSSMEYLRMALLMADNARQHRNETHWSDMKALDNLYQSSQGSAFDIAQDVLAGHAALNGVDPWNIQLCESVSAGKRAVHFSHHSVHIGITPFEARANDRPKIASHWLDMWKTSCDPNIPAIGINAKNSNEEALQREEEMPTFEEDIVAITSEERAEPAEGGKGGEDSSDVLTVEEETPEQVESARTEAEGGSQPAQEADHPEAASVEAKSR